MKRLLAILAFAALGAQAQDNIKMNPAIGLYGGLNINMHSPSFSYDKEYNTSGLNFDENKTSYGANFGLIGYIPLSDIFVIAPRIGYNMANVKLERTGGANSLTFDSKLGYLEISPIMQFHNLLPVKNLYFLGGFEIGVPISKSYDYTFKNATNTVTRSEDIPDASTRFAAAVGAGWMFELSKTVKLSPEVSFRIPFNKVSTANYLDKWNMSQLRIGVNLTFDLVSDDSKTTKTEVKSSTMELGMGSVNYVNRDGSRAPLKTVRVEDMQYSELFPFMPYVFYDEMKSEPSESQLMNSGSEAGAFAIENLPSDAIQINSRTLDIVGYRMNKYPASKITITGSIDNKKEKQHKTLSTQRASYVRDYLVKNYNIAEDRIEVKGGGLPSKPSSSNVADGVAENRRAEISGDDKKLFEPIVIAGDNQRVANPDLVEFLPKIVSSDSVTSWKLDLYQGDRNLKSIKGESEPKAIQWSISPNDLSSKQMPVEYILNVKNSAGIDKTYKGTIPVEYLSITKKKSEELPDKTVSKYSLVLFDFDKADVSQADMEIIDKYIIPAIKFNSTVDVYGYTDRIGDDNYNKQLAEKRAQAVKKVLESKIKDAKYQVHGVGESVSIFDNESPIGRQLSRTVQVYISTPR
jgi:outer membrane protein OmpA-like peptidoglycan-associated protein/opacity protein-like surface antigen